MEPDVFDDPALKRAIQRVCGKETAPAELRNRITRSLRESSAGGPASIPITQGRTSASFLWSRRYALAAAVVLGIVGLGFVLVLRQKDTAPLGVALASALVERHDGCVQGGEHALPSIPQGDFHAMASAYQQQLGRNVIAEPVGDGWKLRGAAICPVLNDRSGHLVFDRGQQTLSLISLPASIASGLKPHETFSFNRSDHALAGFSEGGGFYCIVEHRPGGTVALSDLEGLRGRLQQEIRLANAARRPISQDVLAALMVRALR